MSKVKCHAGASLYRFIPFSNSSIAGRKDIRAPKTPLQFQDSNVMCFSWHGYRQVRPSGLTIAACTFYCGVRMTCVNVD